MKKVINIIIKRWKAKMPVFFKWIMGIGTSVAAIALAVKEIPKGALVEIETICEL